MERRREGGGRGGAGGSFARRHSSIALASASLAKIGRLQRLSHPMDNSNIQPNVLCGATHNGIGNNYKCLLRLFALLALSASAATFILITALMQLVHCYCIAVASLDGTDPLL